MLAPVNAQAHARAHAHAHSNSRRDGQSFGAVLLLERNSTRAHGGTVAGHGRAWASMGEHGSQKMPVDDLPSGARVALVRILNRFACSRWAQ